MCTVTSRGEIEAVETRAVLLRDSSRPQTGGECDAEGEEALQTGCVCVRSMCRWTGATLGRGGGRVDVTKTSSSKSDEGAQRRTKALSPRFRGAGIEKSPGPTRPEGSGASGRLTMGASGGAAARLDRLLRS